MLGNEDRRRLNLEPRVSGLIITDIAPDSPFRDSLAPNVVIMEINRSPITDLASAKRLLQPDRNFLWIYYRGAARFIVITQK